MQYYQICNAYVNIIYALSTTNCECIANPLEIRRKGFKKRIFILRSFFQDEVLA